jgi:hypothetical protein
MVDARVMFIEWVRLSAELFLGVRRFPKFRSGGFPAAKPENPSSSSEPVVVCSQNTNPREFAPIAPDLYQAELCRRNLGTTSRTLEIFYLFFFWGGNQDSQ